MYGRKWKSLLLGLFGLIIIVCAILWFSFDRLVEGVVRPWAMARAEAVLNGEVNLDSLELHWGRWEFSGLRVERPGKFRFSVEQVVARYTFSGLCRRRLESVVLRRPEVVWEQAGAAGGEPLSWPQQPPLRVGGWSVEGGRLLLPWGEDRLVLREIEARGSLDSRYTVEAAAMVGGEPGAALAFSGRGRWEGRPELTITDLLWSGRPLLQGPVTVTPGAESFGATLALAQLDDVDAARLLVALGRQPPWPPETGWEVMAPRLTIRLVGERLSLHLETAAGELRRQGEPWPWESLNLKLVGEAGAWEVEAEAALPGGSHLAGSLSGRWREGLVRVEAADLVLRDETDRLATAALTLEGRPAESAWRGSWSLRVPDTVRLARALAVAVPAGLPNLEALHLRGELATAGGRLLLPAVSVDARLAGTGLGGRVSGRLAARQRPEGWRLEFAQLSVTQLEYLAPDGLSGITGGSLTMAGILALQKEVAFDFHGEAAAGEVLAGSWYADLRGLPLGVALEGVWEPATGRVRLRTGRFDLAGLVSARVQGSLAGERLELNGEVAAPRLDGPFQSRLRQLAAGVLPSIERLELAGGLTVRASGAWSPEGWGIEAAVRPAGTTLAWGEALRLVGLRGELPLLLRRGASAPATDRFATLEWDELRAGPIISAGGRLRLAAGPNRWRLAEPLRLEAAGGWLEVPDFEVGLPAGGPEMRGSLKAAGIELAAVSRALGWPEMGGRLGAELPDIRFAGEELSTGGEALLQVFNGEVRLRGIRVGRPFSPNPTYHADIDFSGIDLQLLTRAFAFGEINGIADGFVHDLRLYGHIPSAFRAVFETREKGRRNISVKAIHNLNTLSQGGLTAALSQGIYRFIDFYRYRKIGILCSLRNDVFRLEGTAKPGTDTYLIYGGWLPPRIDVIVTTPTISFQEMVRRLKRIERADR